MMLVNKGMTNKQIAKDLDISPATVKTLLERLFRISKAKNRIALIHWWQGTDHPNVFDG
ncbi:helix-turn-helix transcriptional regulator [Mesorhizobium sp. M0998]|uniref:helix-turn-helix domain-containing protein n=1 Tax=Mesorhizobium sp. M0998 TaxID=2957044 RepID=UPI0033378795